MKVTILIALLLVICVAYTQAQRCGSQPVRTSCAGQKNEGLGNRPACRRNAGDRWYFNGRERACKKMNYKGCGGNANRYCSKRECERACRRSG